MKIRQNKGYVLHQPLSYVFEMLELGGSYIQKYDTITGSFIPNRSLTPFVLKPQLTITDPDGLIPTGEYSSRLENCIWTVEGWLNGVPLQYVEDVEYTIDTNTHALTFLHNVGVSEIVRLSFSADYVDTRRNDVQHFYWSHDLSTQGEAMWNVTLQVLAPSKLDLSPFKDRGQFSIYAQLMNGENPLADAKSVYLWQRYNGTNWVTIPDNAFWYVSGKNTKVLTVDQKFLQKETLRLLAYPVDKPSEQKYYTILLRRWYGQWEERVLLAQGKYIFPSETKAAAEVTVVNRQGNIPSPEQYFDIEIFFAQGSGDWESVAYGQEAIVQRVDMGSSDPKFGVLCRELSAFVPIALPGGELLSLGDDEVIIAQFPTSEREV